MKLNKGNTGVEMLKNTDKYEDAGNLGDYSKRRVYEKSYEKVGFPNLVTI